MIAWSVVWTAVKSFAGRYWKQLLWVAVAAAVVAGLVYARSVIYDAAYDEAASDFQKRESEINEVWTDRLIENVSARDKYWTAQLDEERERVQRILSENKQVRQSQKELRKALQEQLASFNQLQQEFENADFGTASFTSDADRLLGAAYRAAYGDSSADADGAN